jgi:hypothetical protein
VEIADNLEATNKIANTTVTIPVKHRRRDIEKLVRLLTYLLASVGILWVSNRSEEWATEGEEEGGGKGNQEEENEGGRGGAPVGDGDAFFHTPTSPCCLCCPSCLIPIGNWLSPHFGLLYGCLLHNWVWLSLSLSIELLTDYAFHVKYGLSFFWFCLFFGEERETRMELCVLVMSTLPSWRWWSHFHGFCFLTAITLTSEALLWLWTLWIESSVVVVLEGNPNLIQLDPNLVTYLTVLWHLAFDSEVQVSNSFFDYRSDGKLLDVILWIGGTCLWDSHFLLICLRRAAVQIDGRCYILYEFQRNATFCCINVNRAGINRWKYILLYRIELM